MDDSLRHGGAKTHGRVADVYERTRPGYPEEAIRWLVGPEPATVLELGAGTGKLTAGLLGRGHQVVATDPSAPMLARARTRFKDGWLVQAEAERVPLRRRCVDVVVAGQAFHWFDAATALTEAARVLRPGGVIALAWNLRDETVPWVRRLGRLVGSETLAKNYFAILDESDLFDGVERQEFRHWQQVDRDSLVGLVESRSNVAGMPEDDRNELLAKVGELYDGYGRGHDGMLLPYRTDCFRARVSRGHTQLPDLDPPFDDGLLIDFT